MQSGKLFVSDNMDPSAFMMGMMSMMSMMLFDPMTMGMMPDDGTPAADGNNPAFAQQPPPTSVPQGFVPPPPSDPPSQQRTMPHAEAAQELATRQRERDFEARSARVHRNDGYEVYPMGPPPGYGGFPDQPPPTLASVGPDYGYGGGRGMWGGHETGTEKNDPMFRRWGHRANPPNKGPAPSAMYDFNVEPYPPPQGAILPPGWVMGQPIRKERRVPPPQNEYRGGRPAFRDFSMP